MSFPYNTGSRQIDRRKDRHFATANTTLMHRIARVKLVVTLELRGI